MRLIILLLCGTALVLSGCSHRTVSVSPDGQGAFYPTRDKRFADEPSLPIGLQGNACAMLAARPHWRAALREAKKQWQVEPWFILAFLHQESRFQPKVMSRSMAYGLAQVKIPTWQWYEAKRGRTGVSRERFDDVTDFIGWYTHQNLARNGVAINDVRNQYLAYHEGLGGFEQASYLAKPWLLAVADKVADRAMMYKEQLVGCPL